MGFCQMELQIRCGYSLPEFDTFKLIFQSTNPSRESPKASISLEQGKLSVIDYTVELFTIAANSGVNQPALKDGFLLSETKGSFNSTRFTLTSSCNFKYSRTSSSFHLTEFRIASVVGRDQGTQRICSVTVKLKPIGCNCQSSRGWGLTE